MKKIYTVLFIFLLTYPYVTASERGDLETLDIITREQWGANEEYSYRDSVYWEAILEKWKKNSEKSLSDYQKQLQEKKAEDYNKSVEYINENFGPENTVTHVIAYEGDRRLAWGIKKSDYVNAIIVHHTESEYEDSFDGVRQVYKFHSTSREWGDIGYNYVIGYNGEIFEGKKGGDYTVGAHSKWNNISTVGIAILGDYGHKPINELQYTSLEKLIQHLALKYGIDLSKDYYYHKKCAGAACNIFPLETHLHQTLSGHRDTGHTSCPGDFLYEQIEQIRLDNLELTRGLSPVKRGSESPYFSKNVFQTNQEIVKILKKLSKEKLNALIQILDRRIEMETKNNISHKLKIIRIIAKEVLKS